MTARPLVPPAARAVAGRARRVPVAFGPRFFVLLAAGLILAIPAWIDPRAAWTLGAWNLLVVVLWAADLRRMPPEGLIEVTRTWSAPLGLGVPSRVFVDVRHDAPVPLIVRLLDEVPPALRRELPREVMAVAPGARARLAYDVAPRIRGDVAVGDTWLRVRTPWGIGERWLRAPLGQTVRVYPDLTEARRHSMFLLRSRQVALERRRVRAIGRGREFESLRDYQPGDEPRDVSWTVTARRGKPVTRVYQPERSQAIWILVDGGRLLRARLGDRTKLDAMVNAALGLAEVAVAAGDRVGLITYGRRLHQRLPPDRGASQVRAVLEALATVPAERAEADHAGAAAALLSAQKQRALVVWLTDLAETAGTPEVIEHASRLTPRHLVLFAVTKPVDLLALAGAVPAAADEMFRTLAVQEMLERRDVLLRGLTQRGVLVVELPPGGPTALLIDQYLAIKERNLL
ncbi:MAG TPA: DUF58 domain-containing protein [Vicinamibacterales bacterium]|nr:DUF58 domain-containing protein [Vicinamibacterales bacterium]